MKPTNRPYDSLDVLPLSESTFLILVSLQGEPKQGYAIMKEVEELSHGRVMLSTGILYGAIKRLLQDEWIRRVEVPEDASPGGGYSSVGLTDRRRRIKGDSPDTSTRLQLPVPPPD